MKGIAVVAFLVYFFGSVIVTFVLFGLGWMLAAFVSRDKPNFRQDVQKKFRETHFDPIEVRRALNAEYGTHIYKVLTCERSDSGMLYGTCTVDGGEEYEYTVLGSTGLLYDRLGIVAELPELPEEKTKALEDYFHKRYIDINGNCVRKNCIYCEKNIRREEAHKQAETREEILAREKRYATQMKDMQSLFSSYNNYYDKTTYVSQPNERSQCYMCYSTNCRGHEKYEVTDGTGRVVQTYYTTGNL